MRLPKVLPALVLLAKAAAPGLTAVPFVRALTAAAAYAVVADDVTSILRPGPQCARMLCFRAAPQVKARARSGIEYHYCSRHIPLTGGWSPFVNAGLGAVRLFSWLMALFYPAMIFEEVKKARAGTRAAGG